MLFVSRLEAVPLITIGQVIIPGLLAGLVGIELAPCLRTQLASLLDQPKWISSTEIVSLVTANFAGYLIFILLGSLLSKCSGKRDVLRISTLVAVIAFLITLSILTT